MVLIKALARMPRYHPPIRANLSAVSNNFQVNGEQNNHDTLDTNYLNWVGCAPDVAAC
jgi:hypothetical protein